MSSCSRRSKKSSSPVEDWQLRILWEWQQKQKPPSYPSLEQRRSLATQTGLSIKWISNWLKKVNGVSKKKTGAAVKGALSGSPIVAASTHGPGSPKVAGLEEAIVPSSTGVPPSAVEDRFLVYPSDLGVNAVSESVRSSISQSTRELPGAADLIQVPNSDLQTNHEHLVLCSSLPHRARLVQVSESPSALLHSQRTVNSCGTSLGYDFASSLQHVGSPGSLLSGSQPPSSCGSHSPHESVQTHQFHTNLGGSQSVVPAYPKYTTHDPRPASACMHLDSSVLTSQPSLVPLPSIYWLLFDRDEHSIGGRADTLHGTPLSPPPGGLGGAGVAAASQASATPVSFLAKWEDILALERRVGLSFVKNLSRARQAQPESPEVTPIEQGNPLMNSGHNPPTYLRRVQSSGSTDE